MEAIVCIMHYKQRKLLRKFYCKFHNRFLTVDYIDKKKSNRCWNCKHFIKVGNFKKDQEY
nr:MAG TPA: hypothetical protein [Caudoviricetes sp.]